MLLNILLFSFTQQNKILMVLVVSIPFYIVIIRELIHLAHHYNNVYKDEVTQRGMYSISKYPYLTLLLSPSLFWFTDPVICSTPEDESQGEERDNNTDQQQSTTLLTPMSKPITTGASCICYIWWCR